MVKNTLAAKYRLIAHRAATVSSEWRSQSPRRGIAGLTDAREAGLTAQAVSAAEFLHGRFPAKIESLSVRMYPAKRRYEQDRLTS